MSAHILVVEDDPVLTGLLKLYLEKEGHMVACAADGRMGLELASDAAPDLVILDIMLPGLDGWEVCRRLRTLSQVPVLLLTGLDQESSKIRGLDLGADDYVTKPFAAGELMARVRALLRRNVATDSTGPRKLTYPGLQIDPFRRAVELKGESVELTPKEFELLYLVAQEPGKVFSHAELLKRVWQYPEGTDPRTIHTHVLRLRRKLNTAERSYLQTVWGVGFKFEVCEV